MPTDPSSLRGLRQTLRISKGKPASRHLEYACKALQRISLRFPTVIDERMFSDARGHRRLWLISKVKAAVRALCFRSF